MRLHKLRTVTVTGALITALLCAALGPAIALGNTGGNDPATAVSEALPISGLTGSLESSSTQPRDVYSVYLHSGETLEASMTVTSAETTDTDFDMVLWKRNITSFDDVNWTDWSKAIMWCPSGPSTNVQEHWTFMAADAGTYYLDVHAYVGGGDYTLDAKILDSPVAFKIGSMTIAKSAKKGKKVNMSAVLTPSYNGYYAPVYFHLYRWERGKYRQKKIIEGDGIRNPGRAYSKLTATYKFPKKGKWRVRAEFWDEAHASRFTSYKYIKIK